ncbi:MAG TPA: sugar transferase [Actinomycetota bacterium]|nr:sugar transferase [Actinomycetota bacterium]
MARPRSASGGWTVLRRTDRSVIDLTEPRPALRRFRSVTAARVATDAIIALVLVAMFRPEAVAWDRYVITLALTPLLWTAVFGGFGLYRRTLLPVAEEYRRVVAAASVGVLLLELVTPLWGGGVATDRAVALWVLALVIELGVRTIWRMVIRDLRKRGTLALRTAVVGTNGEAHRIARAIAPSVRGFRPLGFIATSPADAYGAEVIGIVDDLGELIVSERLECLYVASSEVSPERMADLAHLSRRLDIELRVSANLPGVHTERLGMETVDDILGVRVEHACLTGPEAFAKRAFDLVAATLGLIVLSPIMIAVAVAIKVTSPGPILFRQPRITKDGQPFTCLKFRTMHADQRKALEGQVIDLTKPFFKLRDDPRLTRIGAFLRTSSLDELPQLFNVLSGDMSIVGPRPLPEEQVRANPEVLDARHEVRAGMTGWWQVNGRSDVAVDEAVRMDLYYIQNWSLGLDLYIIAKTTIAILARMGAY